MFIPLFALANQTSIVTLAAAPTPLLTVAALHSITRPACAPGGDCAALPRAANTDPTLSLPRGTTQCTNSGPYAACASPADAASNVSGTASLPAGARLCPVSIAKPVPSTPAACGDANQASSEPADATPSANPVVAPSVPEASLGGFDAATRVTLSSNLSTVRNGQKVVLTAAATSSVTDTGAALEIFDRTSNSLVAACGQGNQCSVAYSAGAGQHAFTAYITAPTSQIPGVGISIGSNQVTVGWLDSSVSADHMIVGPGQPVTVTANSTVDVRDTGRWLEIYDLTAGARLTYCAQGTSCSTSIKESTGGVHEIVAYVTGQPEAVSQPIYVTWLAVSLSATSVGPSSGGTVYLRASVNADLSSTPYVVGIYDQQGRLVDHVCKGGASCSVQAWMSGGTVPTYTAIIGQLPATQTHSSIGNVTVPSNSTANLVNVQAKSASLQPTHVLWGVDSCKAIVGDPTGDLFWKIVGGFGTPEFWGRYLTDTVCPGISAAEVALAARYRMGILPIYNDYNCSNVSYYDTGHGYAVAAVAAAQRLGIPTGRVLAIDIEPAGPDCPGAASVDSGFIEGWYDGVRQAGYVPAYYGNGTSGSEFASAWCAAVSALPHIANGSDLWSFEPSLLGRYSKPSAPNFAPYDTGCSGNIEAWQFQLGGTINADVDQDEALSSLPIWYPGT